MKFFQQRFASGHSPFIGGILKYPDAETLYYAVAELTPNANVIHLYSNDFVVVNSERISVDAPITSV